MTDNENAAKSETIHSMVGLPHGHIDFNDEKIVYEYDTDENFVGWHKETGK